MKYLTLCLCVATLTGIWGCSSANEDYAKVDQALRANLVDLTNSQDFDFKVELCNNSISAVEQFLSVHPEGEWAIIAEKSLVQWQQRLNGLQVEQERLEVEKLKELPKIEYASLEQALTSSELALQKTNDFDTRATLCRNAISLTESYLAKYSEGEWPTIAKATLVTWQQRMDENSKTREKLTAELHARLKEKAEEAARKHHPMSEIEDCRLANSANRKDDANLCFADTYEIRMRGTIIGRSIFKMTAEVSGCIDASSHSIERVSDVVLTE